MELKNPARLLTGYAADVEKAFAACASIYLRSQFARHGGDPDEVPSLKNYKAIFEGELKILRDELAKVEKAAALFEEL